MRRMSSGQFRFAFQRSTSSPERDVDSLETITRKRGRESFVRDSSDSGEPSNKRERQWDPELSGVRSGNEGHTELDSMDSRTLGSGSTDCIQSSMASNFNKNAISAFEEYGVKHGQPPEVQVIDQQGPSHQPVFVASAKLGEREVCMETGTTKHEARMKAAEKALNILRTQDQEKADRGGSKRNACNNPVPGKDPVSALLEYCQFMKLGNPDFNLVTQEGPPHMPVFTMEVRLDGQTYGHAQTRSRKEAKKQTAVMALNQLWREGKLTLVFPGAGQSSSNRSTQELDHLDNRNAISELNEYAQKNGKTLKFDKLSDSGPSHKPVFEVQAVLGDSKFEAAKANSLKDAKILAAQKALAKLRPYKQPEDLHRNVSDSGTLPTRLPDLIATSALRQIDKLLLEAPLVGRKVVAAVVMTTEQDKKGTVVSVGSGNRCVKGDCLRQDGKVLHDSHAEILARRGFKRYLYKLLAEGSNDLLVDGSNGKKSFRKNVAFHLYISTAPCGDGALFVHNDQSDYYKTDSAGEAHQPVFSNSKTQGLLRVKQENGEGTIPIEQGFVGQTFDGIQRGERLRVMSCSDKICRWNVLGLQGSLLSRKFEPVYLKSIILGNLYHHGHLSRAACCRVDRGTLDLPPGYRVNHPDLGLATVQDKSRAVEKSSSLCMNWCLGDSGPEITDGTTGMTKKTLNTLMTSSRLCKYALLHQYRASIGQSQDEITYRQLKEMSVDYNQAKRKFRAHMMAQGYGIWVPMPEEVDRFY